MKRKLLKLKCDCKMPNCYLEVEKIVNTVWIALKTFNKVKQDIVLAPKDVEKLIDFLQDKK